MKVDNLMAEIMANRKKLDECKVHSFGEIGEPPYKLNMRLTCKHCNGMMKAIDAYQYVLGYKAAGGNPNDIIDNFQ